MESILKNSFDHLVKQHPCFNGEAHNKHGRIHLPVSPSCNIQCKFCKRGFNKWEKRPGVSNSIITPRKSVELVKKALELCPEITVVGIAGPGDTLATNHALETFKFISTEFPHLINCLSTNGLLLAEKAEKVVEAGVKTITVTVNALDPRVLKDICSHIVLDGKYYTGETAAKLLIEAQLAGIEKIANFGVMVKINTVLIPGVNESQIGEIAKITSSLGASIHNIIPLIPQHEYSNHRPPDCQELNTAREESERHLQVFRHCRQCRADACGVPGADLDFASELYDQPMTTFSHG